MGNKFASGKKALAICDRCGFQFKLPQLKKKVVKGNIIDLLLCPTCWDPDQPQLMLGSFPVEDPQALRDPRPDNSYQVSGLLADGELGGGSRVIQWGWAPVGGARANDAGLTPNNLAMSVLIGTVTVAVT